jgi:hypothetical protein
MGVQVVQAVSSKMMQLRSLKVPAGQVRQVVHAVAPSEAEKVEPSTHARQVCCPVRDWKKPELQSSQAP